MTLCRVDIGIGICLVGTFGGEHPPDNASPRYLKRTACVLGMGLARLGAYSMGEIVR